VRARGATTLDIAQLYRRYGDMVLSRCRTLLGNDADAQEIAQDVFLKAHRNQSSFRGDSAPSTWLYRIATTTCLNHLRARKRRREDIGAEPPPMVADGLLNRVEIRMLLDDLLSDEDDKTRAAAIYHWMDGMTHAETGRMLGLSGAAIRKRLRVFRGKLGNRTPPWLEAS